VHPSLSTPGTIRQARHDGRNVLFVSHCDFSGNSAFHVYSMASELARRGWSPAIAVPGRERGVRELGRPGFQVLSYKAVRRGHLLFPDGQGPDLVYAFTPRGPVRALTLDVLDRFRCRYVVHLEDNEVAVSDAVGGVYDPGATRAFMEAAVGMSVIVDRLLEFKPPQVPGVVVWPGYDAAIERVTRPRTAIRRDVGLDGGEVAVVYPGSVHEANADEVGALYEAVRRMRLEGYPLVLIKSGFNAVSAKRLPRLGDGIHDLGWIRRRRVFELLHAADILVQPGAPGPFNDYRFPSKLPEFLASGGPVILPRTNIGLHLEDGVQALLLDSGGTDEIRHKLEPLIAGADLRSALGAKGREFAREQLQWSKSVDRLVEFLEPLGA
jgi:glycosyltransferase involved in cell wall biosynthesis